MAVRTVDPLGKGKIANDGDLKLAGRKSFEKFDDSHWRGHPRRERKPEFKEGRYPPLDVPACLSFLLMWVVTRIGAEEKELPTDKSQRGFRSTLDRMSSHHPTIDQHQGGCLRTS